MPQFSGIITYWAFLGDIMKTLLFLFAIFHLTVFVCLAQNDSASVKADANSCELNSLHLDGLRNELANNPTATITAKFYAGKSENLAVSERRTSYIRKFLEQNKGFDLSRFEFINSGTLETNEKPKVEFYILQAGETEGKLYLVTYSQLNRTPCLDCCEGSFEPKYIGSKSKPKLKKKPTKQRKKRGK